MTMNEVPATDADIKDPRKFEDTATPMTYEPNKQFFNHKTNALECPWTVRRYR